MWKQCDLSLVWKRQVKYRRNVNILILKFTFSMAVASTSKRERYTFAHYSRYCIPIEFSLYSKTGHPGRTLVRQCSRTVRWGHGGWSQEGVIFGNWVLPKATRVPVDMRNETTIGVCGHEKWNNSYYPAHNIHILFTHPIICMYSIKYPLFGYKKTSKIEIDRQLQNFINPFSASVSQ